MPGFARSGWRFRGYYSRIRRRKGSRSSTHAERSPCGIRVDEAEPAPTQLFSTRQGDVCNYACTRTMETFFGTTLQGLHGSSVSCPFQDTKQSQSTTATMARESGRL